MLVELSKVPLGGGTVPALFFSSDSAVRNMDFVHNSRFEGKADIDIRGLPALANSPTRDVYLYVKTRNLPPHGEKAIELPLRQMEAARRVAAAPPKNDGKLPPIMEHDDKQLSVAAPIKTHAAATTRAASSRSLSSDLAVAQPSAAAIAAAAAAAPAAATAQVPPPVDDTLAKSPYEHLAEVWPTYEVHAYHDTGRTIVLNGKKHKLVEPMVPFGYFVEHEGPLYGFVHSLAAKNGAELEQLADNFYRVHVPNGGSVQLTTVIESQDKPKVVEPPPQVEHAKIKGSCACGVLGTGTGKNGLGAVLAGLMLGLGLAWRSSRRRR